MKEQLIYDLALVQEGVWEGRVFDHPEIVAQGETMEGARASLVGLAALYFDTNEEDLDMIDIVRIGSGVEEAEAVTVTAFDSRRSPVFTLTLLMMLFFAAGMIVNHYLF
jgi:predicted RNase H-like HicB family nuclease